MMMQEKILDAYARELEIATYSYDMMGKMLDKEFVKSRIDLLGVTEFYIYGGGYLGIQLYQAVENMAGVPAIVDKSGGLLLNIPGIPVLNVERLKQVYKGQKVIITPVKFYREIYGELSSFVLTDQIIFLGELMGGIL